MGKRFWFLLVSTSWAAWAHEVVELQTVEVVGWGYELLGEAQSASQGVVGRALTAGVAFDHPRGFFGSMRFRHFFGRSQPPEGRHLDQTADRGGALL